MLIIKVLGLIFVLVFATNTYAQSQLPGLPSNIVYDDGVSKDLIKRYEAAPRVLVKELHPDLSIEEYVLRNISIIRQLSTNGEFVTNQEVKDLHDLELHQKRSSQVESLIRYDENFDAKVTKEEFLSIIDRQSRMRKTGAHPSNDASFINRFYTFDKNEDGILDYKEMSTLPEAIDGRQSAQRSNDIDDYLALDPNKDGKLTIPEMEQISRDAFRIIDIDNNSIISDSENKQYHKFWTMNSPSGFECKIPTISEDSRVVLIGAHRGMYLPDVSSSGQDNPMSALKINIKEQTRPLHLFIVTRNPSIISFSGDMEKLSHVYVSSTHSNKGDISASGVSNLKKEQVTFLPAKCLGSITAGNNERAKELFKVRTGSKIDVIANQASVQDINIYFDRVEFNQPDSGRGLSSVIAPEGFDQALWTEVARHYPAGILRIDIAKVISIKPPEKYKLLPEYAGLAQLAHQGIIKKQGNQVFEIIKPLERFPAGLTGSKTVKFILSNNIELPKGDIGNSCVVRIEDETEKTILGPGGACRLR